MSETPIPNRLVAVPPSLHKLLGEVLENPNGWDQEVQAKRLRKVVDCAYREGYRDGYRDGHTDAQAGHDERARAHVCSASSDNIDVSTALASSAESERKERDR